jgi:hypothetical protein
MAWRARRAGAAWSFLAGIGNIAQNFPFTWGVLGNVLANQDFRITGIKSNVDAR